MPCLETTVKHFLKRINPIFSVYPDGRVCISILHAPGDDPMGYESSAERWSPVQSVEKILLSVVSMLAGKELFLLKTQTSMFSDTPTFCLHHHVFLWIV
jgi:hypothetical protein